MKAPRSRAPAAPQTNNASRATPQLRTRPDPPAASDRSTEGRDARPEGRVWRQRQAMIHHSPRVKPLARYQEMAEQSPRAQDLGQLQAMVDSSPHVTVQRKRQAQVNTSPRQVAQRRQLQRTFGQPVQRQGEWDEDELQMKATSDALQMQGMEDEELLQGKFETIQRQEELEDDELQMQAKTGTIQRQGMEDEELLQGKFVGNHTPTQHQGSEEAVENRSGMPDGLQSGLEQLSGLDLSGVRVHYHSAKPAQLHALAYTQGQDIEVGPGHEQHLPHEGWHVVQQMQGKVRPTMQAKGVAINDDAGLEHEADVMGAKALQMRRLDPGDTGTAAQATSAAPRERVPREASEIPSAATGGALPQAARKNRVEE